MEKGNKSDFARGQFLDLIPGIAVLSFSDGKWIQANTLATSIFGPTQQSWEALVPAEERSRFLAHWMMGVRTKLPFSFEFRHADGRGEKTISFSATPQFAEGELTWLCIGQESAQSLVHSPEEKRTEAELQLLADYLPQMVWSAHANGVFDFCNKQWLKFTGLSREEFRRSGWRSVLHPDDLEKCLKDWEVAVRSGNSYYGERRFRSANGKYRWFLGKASPLKDAEGRVIKWFGTCTDIHEQKESFHQAQEAKSYLQTVIDHAEISIWSTDEKGILKFFEGKGLKTRNVVREDFLGKSVWEMNQERPEILRMLKTAWDGLPSSGEVFFEGRWLESHITPIFHDSGLLKGVVGVTIDITTRKNAIEKARKAEEQLLTVIHNAPISLWSINKDGFCILSEGKSLHLLGLLPQGKAGVGWASLEEEFPECVGNIKRALAGESFTATTFLPKLGRWHEIHYSPVFDTENQIIAMVGVSTDVTDRKEAERLLISEQAALESSRLKTEFLANMSHEIRTPMNSMVATTEFLSETSLSNEQFGYVQTIQSSLSHLLLVVNDILDLSKIEVGKMILEEVSYNISSLLLGVKREMESSAQKKGVTVICEISSVPQQVRGDPTRVRQILLNLLANAVKFTNQGNISLRASSENSFLKFEVQDTGIGIEATDLKSIFEPFVQADASTTRKFGGSGLGLAICKRLVTLMGGELGVESEVNKGTKFWFRLPLLSAPARIDLRRKAKVLVAEDIPANQKVLSLLLQKIGFESTLVADGFEALEALKKESFDLVLMDCQMPRMDGFTAARQIRQELGLSIPIVAVTANALPEVREKCRQAGMNDFLAKPITRETLQRALSPWLKEEAPSQEEDLLDLFLELDPENPKKLLAEMLALYRKNTVDKMTLLGDAVVRQDLAFLEKESHRIKSSSCYLGGKKLGELCQRMESLASAGRGEEMESLFAQISEEVHELDKKVSAILQ